MNLNFKDVEVRVGSTDSTLFKISEFSIPHGSRLLIRGPSGRGKTTFLHLIAGLLKPYRGSVLLNNLRIDELTEDESAKLRRESIAIVFQKLNLLDHLTAFENVMLVKAATRDSAHGALEKVGLRQRANDFVSKMSLGEQQRVAVARVLSSDASIILADEPTSSLDDKNAGDVIQLLLQASAGKTLVVVSHDHRIETFFAAQDRKIFEEFAR